MSFEEVKNLSAPMEIYGNDGDLNPDFASDAFCQMGREELLEFTPGVLADVILHSREVFTKATEIEYVAENLLAACMTALVNKEPNLTKLFTSLTHNGTRNMTTEELSELLHGFVFAKSEELSVLMALDKMMQ